MVSVLVFLALAVLLAASSVRCGHFSIVDTTVGGMLASKRIQNDDTGKETLAVPPFVEI